MANNFIKVRGLGLGRNVNSSVLGGFDVSGTVEVIVDDFNFYQYGIGAERAGAGSVADPFEIQEVENIGYSAGQFPSLRLEIGSEGGANDDTVDITGVVVNDFTLNANVGEAMTASINFVGQTVVTGTSLAAFTASTTKPFVFQEGTVDINGESFDAMSFSLTVAQNLKVDHRDLGSRFIKQPTTGVRDYTFSLTVRRNFDDTVSTLSESELRELFLGSVGATSPETGGTATAVPVSLDITEGASTGDRVVNIDLENCHFDVRAETITIDGQTIEATVDGYGHAGLTDGSVKVPIRYYTI